MKKIALITGAGSGIGRSVALALGRNGYKVHICGRTEASLVETVSMSETRNMEWHLADVAQPKAVTRLFESIQASDERLDLLFNNAGINIPALPFDEIAFEAWRKVVDVNLSGSFYCAQAAFRMMKSQRPSGGRIINNGSVSAHVPRPYSVPYTATKHAITGLTRSISLEGRSHNIACGQIDIGNALTAMAEKMTAGVPQADGSIQVEPTIAVEHVVDAILYMANLPLEVNVPFITVMANGMPYMGRG